MLLLLLLLLPPLLLGALARAAAEPAAREHLDGLPAYHYRAPIKVECMNRSSETGEHLENANHELQWVPFPVCNETGKPLEFHYGYEGEANCTLDFVSDPFFHLLEFYVHNDAPMSCRLPARPPAQVDIVGETPPPREYIPLVFALAGTLQMSHMHISTHMNVLLHSMPKHHLRPHDSGVLDSAIAYSTSPLSHMQGSQTARIIPGEPLPLTFSVRWFPTPHLPKTEGKVEWRGLGGRGFAPGALLHSLVSFAAGVLVAGLYTLGVVLPRRLRARSMGEQPLLLVGADPLGPHVPDVEAASERAQGRHAPVHQAGQLGRPRRRPTRRELVDEKRRQRQLQHGLDVQKGLEPGLVAEGRKVWVPGRGCPPRAQGQEPVEGRRGILPEESGVQGD
ncbi:hypothetical protein UVI_02059380 [Ustilaginoidea virens]|uniref:Uncharacterized protein n=1 Tax=Ustilaginoidea virens TaxID=1159556 RepID=A0A1B5L5W1_USTVR|nr:hypothetical protein UVI_02059380 [Ustilaginoidea virens]